MTSSDPERPIDAAVQPAEDGVDVSLIRWMLSLTPEERLAVLQGFIDSIVELSAISPRSATSTPATAIQQDASSAPKRSRSRAMDTTC